jgi:hypothetical protein
LQINAIPEDHFAIYLDRPASFSSEIRCIDEERSVPLPESNVLYVQPGKICGVQLTFPSFD